MEELFTFENYDGFALRLIGNFNTEHHDSIQLFLGGLEHPLLVSDRYYGEESKNPQLAAATAIIAAIFDQWLDTLSPQAKQAIQDKCVIQPLENYGTDQKTAYVRHEHFCFPADPEIQRVLQNALPILSTMIKSRKEDLERALLEGQNIALKNPYPEYMEAQGAAIAKVRETGCLYRSPGCDN